MYKLYRYHSTRVIVLFMTLLVTVCCARSVNAQQTADMTIGSSVTIGVYEEPPAPTYTCSEAADLSPIGLAAKDAISGTHFSAHTTCNSFTGDQSDIDWIVDVPSVSAETSPTTAEDFYASIAQMLSETEETFSMSTLWFRSHQQENELNLLRHYIAPAVRALHDRTPLDGPYPLLRFAYADSRFPGDFVLPIDDVDEVYDDIVAQLPPPNEEAWRVSIAIANVGKIVDVPWNHSKIAVRDYRHAIVGGMNWDLDYVQPVDIDADGVYTETIMQKGQHFTVHRLYDLSLHVEGEAALAAGRYFDKLWRRTISNLLPSQYEHCKVSWRIAPDWSHDCALEMVPPYSTAVLSSDEETIQTIEMETVHHVFGLGRGHVDWWSVLDRSEKDFGADAAILAAINQTSSTLHISQHQLSSAQGDGLGVVDEVIDAIIAAVVDRGVTVKIMLSKPWGSESADSLETVFGYLDSQLHLYAEQQYGRGTPAQLEKINAAHKRLKFAPFRVPFAGKPDKVKHLFHTHNKFIVFDEVAFYVGSQNLYPSAIGDTPGPELNEYGFLVDDVGLTTQILAEYWNPSWEQVELEERVFASAYQISEGQCCSYLLFLPTIQR